MFERARNIFKNIKKSIGSEEYKENISEFQKALEKLVCEYDTADWENRFIVGGCFGGSFLCIVKFNELQMQMAKRKKIRH